MPLHGTTASESHYCKLAQIPFVRANVFSQSKVMPSLLNLKEFLVVCALTAARWTVCHCWTWQNNDNKMSQVSAGDNIDELWADSYRAVSLSAPQRHRVLVDVHAERVASVNCRLLGCEILKVRQLAGTQQRVVVPQQFHPLCVYTKSTSELYIKVIKTVNQLHDGWGQVKPICVFVCVCVWFYWRWPVELQYVMHSAYSVNSRDNRTNVQRSTVAYN